MAEQTTIETLEAYAASLSESSARANAASELQHQYVNGGPTVEVETESGLVPTLAKQAVQGQEQIAAVLEDVATQLSGAAVYDTVAKGLLKTINGGYFSVPSPNQSEYLILYKNNAGAAVEIKRYPSGTAVDSILGLIYPSTNVAAVVASVADADGFELMQLLGNGLLKTPAFEIGSSGVQVSGLSIQHVDLPAFAAGINIMDMDGFHYPLDPETTSVEPEQETTDSVLLSLRKSLANELEDVFLRLVADSIGWGLTVTGGGISTPRAHALTDVRNNLTSPSWANLLHQYFGARYSNGALSNPAPGVALYEHAHTIDVSTAPTISVVNTSSRKSLEKQLVNDAAAVLGVLCVVPGSCSMTFSTVGTGLTIVYAETPTSGSFEVLVDGRVENAVVATGAPTSYGKAVEVTFPFGRHSVELRCTGSVSFEAVKKIRRIRFANDGLIGTNTKEWLPSGVLLPNSIANDDTHVLVQLGTNDRASTYDPNDPARTKRALESIADYIINARGKSLVLMAANYADDDYPLLTQFKYSQADVARVVAQLAGELGCGYVDNYHATLKQKLAGQAFLADRLHPNDAGHMQMFINFVDSLERA